MARTFIVVAGVYGALAVALGAFGAHGLTGMVASLDEGAKRLDWWQTAAHYHLIHALALALVALMLARVTSKPGAAAGWAFCVGVPIFSGTLYAMALGAPRWLGAITPVGGLAMIAGWVLLAVAGSRALASAGQLR